MPARPDQLWIEAEDDRLHAAYATTYGHKLKAQFPGRTNRAIYQRAALLGLRSKTLWTKEDDAVVVTQYPRIGAAACATLLNRTLAATYARAKHLGVKGARNESSWTSEDDDVLRAYLTEGLDECAARLGHSRRAIRDRVRILGLVAPTKEKPEVGKTYGQIKVVAYLGLRARRNGVGHNHWWSIECVCGERLEIRQDLLSGSRRVKSCGHDRSENLRQKNKLKGVIPGLQSMFTSYKQGAARRNLPFELTKSEFYELISSNCYFCGVPPVATGGYSGLPHNGIDRADSTIGYVKENCLPACAIDNFNKRSLPLAEYEAYLERVTAFRMSLT